VEPGPFDAVVARSVLHHVVTPRAFVQSLVARLGPGGVLVVSDHTTDPVHEQAAWHQGIERLRDHTHTTCLTPGELVDLLAVAGLVDLRLSEDEFVLDFDEWFDRGTPAEPKHVVRDRLLDGGHARGFSPLQLSDGRVSIRCVRTLVRGRRP
jgi:SAM-dependent methyltransferase